MRLIIYSLLLALISFSSFAQIVTKKLFVTGCEDCAVNLFGGGINLDGNLMHNAYTNVGFSQAKKYFNQELFPNGEFKEHLANTGNPRGAGTYLGLFNGKEVYAPFPIDSGYHYYEYDGLQLEKIKLPASNPDSLGVPLITINHSKTAIAFLTDDSITIKTANSTLHIYADSVRGIYLSDNHLYVIRGWNSRTLMVYELMNATLVDTVHLQYNSTLKTSPITSELMLYDTLDSFLEWSDTGFINRSFPEVYAKRPIPMLDLEHVNFVEGIGNTYYVIYSPRFFGFSDGISIDTTSISGFEIPTNSISPFRNVSSAHFVDNTNSLHVVGGDYSIYKQKFLEVTPQLNFTIGTARLGAPTEILTTKGNTLYTISKRAVLKTVDFENLETVYKFKNGELGSTSSVGRGVISKEGHILFRNGSLIYRIQNGVLDTLLSDVREFDLDTNTNRLVYITSTDQKLMSLNYPAQNPTSISENNTQYFALALDEKRGDIRVLEKDVNHTNYATRIDSLGIRHKTPVNTGISYSEAESYDGLYVPSARTWISGWYLLNDSIVYQPVSHSRIDKNGKVVSLADGDIIYDILNEKRLIRNTTIDTDNRISFSQNNFEIGERYLYTSVSAPNGVHLIRLDYQYMVPEIQVLDIGNYRFPITSHGNHAIWNRESYISEYPKGSAFGTIHHVNQAFSALKTDSTLVHSNLGTRTNLTEDGAWGTKPSTISGQGVFKVDLAEVENHIANYNSPNYSMPLSFLLWPAHGNNSAGESTCIAPFVDRNNNGYYDPKNGDTPFIKGHQAIYTIHHSLRTSGNESAFEIHNMYYGYDTSDVLLNNTIFLDTRVINKSNQPFYKPALASSNYGVYFERNNILYNNSLMGTDSLLQMPYNYVNPSSNPDTMLPAIGFMALNETIDYSLGFIKWGTFYEWGIDQKGVRSNHTGNYGHGDTKYPLRYKMTFPTLETDTIKPITNYMFTGYPEHGTGWIPPSDLHINGRMVYSVNGNHVLPGDTFSVETAYILAIDSTGGHKESIALLRQRAAQLKTWYAQNKVEWPAGPCSGIPASVNERGENAAPDWKMYPNPTQEVLTIDWPHAQTMINIYSITGSLMLSTQIQEGLNTVNVSKLNEGMYLVMPEEKVGVRKLVIR